ncbi:MAG: hypothetical protein GY750_19490 [Lentisphaerae bacterium]|nr:hypothetical protein [Lentisphaerota bacterium]MCP4103581.1 hypothetical protein [Lentisphaerota bacterium]
MWQLEYWAVLTKMIYFFKDSAEQLGAVNRKLADTFNLLYGAVKLHRECFAKGTFDFARTREYVTILCVAVFQLLESSARLNMEQIEALCLSEELADVSLCAASSLALDKLDLVIKNFFDVLKESVNSVPVDCSIEQIVGKDRFKLMDYDVFDIVSFSAERLNYLMEGYCIPIFH